MDYQSIDRPTDLLDSILFYSIIVESKRCCKKRWWGVGALVYGLID